LAVILLAAVGPSDSLGQEPGAAPSPISVGDANTQGVAAIVNDKLISEYDVDQRVAMFIVTSGIVNPTAETLAQIREQVLRAMEDEILQIEEATRLGITVADQEIDGAIEQVAGDNGMTTDQILAMLGSAGVQPQTFREQMRSQIAWGKLVQGRYAGGIVITEDQVNSALERLQGGAVQTQYAVSEIFLSVDQPEDEQEVQQNAQQIVQQLSFGAAFPEVARQFSQSPSAAGGGVIGWVQQDQLPDEIGEVLSEMEPGQLAGPVRSEGGYYIVQLHDRREPAGNLTPQEASLGPDGPFPLDRLLLPAPAGGPADLRQQALSFAQTLRSQIVSCEQLPQISRQIEGSVYMRLGPMRLADLAQPLAEAVRATPAGGVTQPVMSDAGVELIVRCDGSGVTANPIQIPTRDELRQQLFVQQITVLSRSYMRDLRRDAVVETR